MWHIHINTLLRFNLLSPTTAYHCSFLFQNLTVSLSIFNSLYVQSKGKARGRHLLPELAVPGISQVTHLALTKRRQLLLLVYLCLYIVLLPVSDLPKYCGNLAFHFQLLSTLDFFMHAVLLDLVLFFRNVLIEVFFSQTREVEKSVHLREQINQIFQIST